jgi:hypothetical protein
MLVWLYLRRAFGWRAAAAFAWYPISMWIGIVYMAEHYVFDALIGIAYAGITYLIVNWLFDHHAATLHRWISRWRGQKVTGVAAQSRS